MKSLEQLPALLTETKIQEVSVELAAFERVPIPAKQVFADVMISLNSLEIGFNSTATPELIQSVLIAVSMLGDISKAESIYLACGYNDMRNYVNRLIMGSTNKD